MTITLPKSVEEKIASLPQEEVEAVLIRLAEKHQNKETVLADALQKGLDASAEGRVIKVSTDDERKALFKGVRDRALQKASQ